MDDYGFDKSFYDSDSGMRDFVIMQRKKFKRLLEEKSINANSIIRSIIRSDLVQFFEAERNRLSNELHEQYNNPNGEIIINLNYQFELNKINKYIDSKIETELNTIINLLEHEDIEKPLPLGFNIPDIIKTSPLVPETDAALDSEFNTDPILRSKIESEVLSEINTKLQLAHDDIKQLMKLDPSNPAINDLRNQILYYYKNYIENKTELYNEVKKRLVQQKPTQAAVNPIMNLDSKPCYFESSRSGTGQILRDRVESETSGVQRTMYGHVLVNETSLPSRKKSIWDR